MTGRKYSSFEYPLVDVGKIDTSVPYAVREADVRTFFGYRLPLGTGFGLGVQGFFSHVESNVGPLPGSEGSNEGWGWNSLNFMGGELSLGRTPTPALALGIGASAGTKNGNVSDSRGEISDEKTSPPDFFRAAEAGLVARFLNGALVYSLDVGTSSFKDYSLETPQIELEEKTGVPVFLDTGITWGFNEMNDFLVLKYMFSIVKTDSDNSNSVPCAQFMPAGARRKRDSMSAVLSVEEPRLNTPFTAPLPLFIPGPLIQGFTSNHGLLDGGILCRNNFLIQSGRFSRIKWLSTL